MEFLSTSQLHKYEGIIDEIKEQFAKNERLKKQLEEENNKVIVSHLANRELCEKVSHVEVKIFSDIASLLNLYAEELDVNYDRLVCEDCKFYLIEVYVSKPLVQKLKDLNWSLHITIRNENVCINKTLNVPRKVPVLDVIPVPNNVIDCSIETSLMFLLNDKWMIIKLHTVLVDISYHFHKNKEKQIGYKNQNIAQITQCYNDTLNIEDLLKKQLTLEYKLVCDVDRSHFIQTILKNSYHKLDIELFSNFENENVSVLQFYIGTEQHKIVYEKNTKVLTMTANINNLCCLKKYFFNEFHCQNSFNEYLIKEIKVKEKYSEDSTEANIYYKIIRKTWLKLPV